MASTASGSASCDPGTGSTLKLIPIEIGFNKEGIIHRGVRSMCDYSLHAVASRPARVGDRLVTKGFSNTWTRGFSGIAEPAVAVCLLPGTELAFETEIDWDRPFKLFRRKPCLGKVVRFRQINVGNQYAHHDAIEFPNGKLVLLTLLCEGQRATVLQLPVRSEAADKTPEKTPLHVG
jgi:hypothetical protein